MVRFLEVVFSILLLVLLGWAILAFIIISSYYYRTNGLFIQKRIGKNKQPFTIYKIRSLPLEQQRKNSFGIFIRKFKLDELPQLINVLKGDMSFVGPRPELPEYYQLHKGFPMELFQLKPGITGLASIYFFNEDQLRKKKSGDAFEKWMFLRKNTLNLIYLNNKSWLLDMYIIWRTIICFFKKP